MAEDRSIEDLLDDRARVNKKNEEAATKDAPSAAIPPGMERRKDVSVDELIKEMNRIPLFMTSLDDTDGEGGENVELEALRALAYEGTRAEVAQNFREQGTELIRLEKRYREAAEYYTKALNALRAPPPVPEEGPAEIDVGGKVIDEEAEAEKERSIEEVCLVNRALCHLEMKNYGSCTRDCAAALRLNPRNVKSWFRAASACLALDKIPEAIDACQQGLKWDPSNSALQSLMTRSEKRGVQLADLEAERRHREERKRLEQVTLRRALEQRSIRTRATPRPPEMPEAEIALEEPTDPLSTLSFPVLLLYPAHAQTDFIKQFREGETVAEHLEYIFPLPWDETREYGLGSVECYMETVAGGLIKAGKKLSLGKLLGSGKLEIVDGLVKVNVVPQSKAAQWIEEFKIRRGKQ